MPFPFFTVAQRTESHLTDTVPAVTDRSPADTETAVSQTQVSTGIYNTIFYFLVISEVILERKADL